MALNKEINRSKKASFIFDAIIAFIMTIIGFFGVFVYTAEYNGENNGDIVSFLPTIADSNLKLVGFKKFSYTGFQIRISTLLLIFISFYTVALVIYIMKHRKNKICERDSEIIELRKTIECLTEDNNKGRNIEVKKSDRISDVIKKFIETNSEIETIQMYKYKHKLEKDKIIYDITPFDNWYGNIVGDANIVNTTYRINRSVINEYNSIKSISITGDKNKFLDRIKKLADEITKNWTSSGRNSVTDRIVENYSLLQIALNLYSSEQIIKYKGLNNEILTYIEREKRTGILCGLITQDYHVFSHEDLGSKRNRIYISKCVSINNYDCIFVIIFNKSITNKSSDIKLVKRFGEFFYNILANDLKIVYNDYKLKK